MSSPLPSQIPSQYAGPTSGRDVPGYQALVLGPKFARAALCVPVINEGERIARQLVKMASLAGATGGPVDIVIADGGSTDGSLEPDVLAKHNVRCRLTKTGPGKLGAQIRMAFDWCLQEGYEHIVLIDGNDKDEPVEVLRFLTKLQAGFDFVQGSRFVPGGKAIRNPASRIWGIKLLHAPMLSVASRVHFTDTTNGFRAYSARLLLDPRMAVFRAELAGYELHYYLSRRAARLGYAICEVPVSRIYPESGEIPTKIGGWQGNVKVLRCLWDVCVGAYDPKEGPV
jgi:dolichol-phosphate mannosyltransferase